MAALAIFKFVIIFHKLERRGHLLIGERPVAVQVVEVVAAFLQENADRFFLGFANDAGDDIAATETAAERESGR